MNKINKQTIRFEKLLPHLASNIKQVQADQLSSAPPLKPSENLRFFMISGGTEVNNPLNCTQHHQQNLTTSP